MIFITGPHGAGKTTIAKLLVEHNFIYLDLGGIIREKHFEENSGLDFKLWCQKNEKVKGESFTDDIVIAEIERMQDDFRLNGSQPVDVVIVGNRSYKGIEYIINKKFNFNNRGNYIIYIDAPIRYLFKRYCKRENKEISMSQFKILLNRDIELGLSTIVKHADMRIWNTGLVEKLEIEVKKIIKITSKGKKYGNL